MLFLILAILSSSMVSIVMRVSADKVSAILSMLAVNYLLRALMGALYAKFQLWQPGTSGFSAMLVMGVLAGALYLGGFVKLESSIRKSGVVLSSVFMKLGLLIPIILSLVVFNEIPTVAQIVGFVLALFAIVHLQFCKLIQLLHFQFYLM